jgi:hypothetical protein
MIRSRFARCARPIAACLLLGLLAACGGAGNRVVTQAGIEGEWPRPASAEPPGPAPVAGSQLSCTEKMMTSTIPSQ